MIFEIAIYKMSCPDIHAAFSMAAIHASNLFLLPLTVSTEDIATCMMGWSTITHTRRLASLTTYLTCSTGVTPAGFKVMLGLFKWLL